MTVFAVGREIHQKQIYLQGYSHDAISPTIELQFKLGVEMTVKHKDDVTPGRVLILGGTGKMGQATARAVIHRSGTAILVGRSVENLERAASDLDGQVETQLADVSDANVLEATLRSAEADHIVVAISAKANASSIPETPVADAQAAFSRLWGTYVALHLAPKFLPKGGSVTLISGSSARTSAPGLGVWGALHGSIEALARAASFELAPIRVNTVSPGGIGLEPDRQLLEHRASPSDIGQAILSLILNPAVTGAVLDVDAGERKGHWSGDWTDR